MLNRDGMSFMEFCEERVAIRQHGLKEDSAERYDRFIKFFRSWCKIVYFADVTDKNVILMDEALSEKKMTAYSRWHNYHRFLNSFIIDAVNEGRLSRNPYKWVTITRKQEKKTLDKFLTKKEVERLKKLPLNGHLERVRDLFIFQVYTCLAYVDLASFDANKIEEVNGRKMYVGNRGKTGQEFSFLLLEPAVKVLEKYGGALPIITNQKYNDYLKVLAAMAKINKPLSSHYARHTGATLLLNAGVDMEVVAKILGHSSTRITRQVYAKLLDSTVADAMEKAGI
jgi:site-specific recombinase XerD